MHGGRSPVAGPAFVEPGPASYCAAAPTFICSSNPMPEGAQPESRPRPAAPVGSVPSGGVLGGIACAVGSFAIFALHDAAIKWVVMAEYSPWQVLFSCSIVILWICRALSRHRMVNQTVRSPIRNALLARAIGLLLAWICFYSAAGKLQLAGLMTIYFA